MKPSRCQGLTLIELLATTALAGLLMVTLLHVIEATGRSRAAMDASPLYDEAWRHRLANLIRKDVTRARDIRWQDDRLVLEGWNGWDRTTREPAHEPALTVYRLIDPSNASTPGRLLVREQRDLLDLGQQQPTRELMAFGVTALTFTPVPAPRRDTESSPASANNSGITVRNEPVNAAQNQTVLALTFKQSDRLEVLMPSNPQLSTRRAP